MVTYLRQLEVIKILRINEIFKSIQGEGKYAGYPVLFIRLAGCTRKCDFCDTKYHIENQTMRVEDVAKEIRASKAKIIVWTGGEPTLQMYDIMQVQDILTDIYSKNNNSVRHHLETNGDIQFDYDRFDYIAFSPKDEVACKNVRHSIAKLSYFSNDYDIKIVTDLTMNKNLIPYATMLMPLTLAKLPDAPEHSRYSIVWEKLLQQENQKIEQAVWIFCTLNDVRFCLRQHIHVWGQNRGV